MPDDFFNKQDPKVDDTTPTPVKIGEKEYSQEELTKLVGLCKTEQEYETKWNRPIKSPRNWPILRGSRLNKQDFWKSKNRRT